MSRADGITLSGMVTQVFPNSMFEVTVENNHKVMCSISGKLRLNNIKILNGDKVDISVSPYDITKGRIIWRR